MSSKISEADREIYFHVMDFLKSLEAYFSIGALPLTNQDRLEELIKKSFEAGWFLDAFEILLEVNKQYQSRKLDYENEFSKPYFDIEINFEQDFGCLKSIKGLEHKMSLKSKKEAFNRINGVTGVLCNLENDQVLSPKIKEVVFCIQTDWFEAAFARFNDFFEQNYCLDQEVFKVKFEKHQNVCNLIIADELVLEFQNDSNAGKIFMNIFEQFQDTDPESSVVYISVDEADKILTKGTSISKFLNNIGFTEDNLLKDLFWGRSGNKNGIYFQRTILKRDLINLKSYKKKVVELINQLPYCKHTIIAD